MEKFFLGALFAGEKLDIINQQSSSGAVVLLEGLHFVSAQSLYHFADEPFGVQIKHPGVLVLLVNQVAGSV